METRVDASGTGRPGVEDPAAIAREAPRSDRAVGSPRRVVYVSYDGLSEQLGQSQVLPYLHGLVQRGHTIDVITFEKPGVPLYFRRPIAPGLRATALRYHRRPTAPATLFDMAQGLNAVALHAMLQRADLVHVRSYVPGAIVLPWVFAARTPFLFDTRGMWADEKVDAGAWPRDGVLYRTAKRVERSLLTHADAVTVLTHAFQRYLRESYAHRADVRAPIHVIPTCTDLEHFSPTVAPDPALAAQLGGYKVLAFVGSLGGRNGSEMMARFYLAWREAAGHHARLLVLSRDEPTAIGRVLAEAGAGDELVHRFADRRDVPRLMRCASAGIVFYRPMPNTIGTAPTKLGELLACGVPVVANPIGDVGLVLEGSSAGVLMPEGDAALAPAARALLALTDDPATARRARETAERWFGLERAVAAYDALYRAMPRRHGGPISTSDRSWL